MIIRTQLTRAPSSTPIDEYYERQGNGTWEWLSIYSGSAPTGHYTISVWASVDLAGTVTITGTNDPLLRQRLTLQLLGRSYIGEQMRGYLPFLVNNSATIKAILNVQGLQLDSLHDALLHIIYDNYILTASSERIAWWERVLEIVPNGTLAQRKQFILATLRSGNKLNEAKIKQIVSAYTGEDNAVVSFANSTIYVRILPSALGEVYIYSDIYKSLRPRVPAHLNLQVERYYSTWRDIKDNFGSWQSIANMTDWQEVKDYM